MRVKENARDVKKCNLKSALASHAVAYNHKINFDKVKVIDQEKNYKRRMFSEMLNINFFNNTVNRTEDTIYLKNVYKNTVNLIQKFTDSH